MRGKFKHMDKTSYILGGMNLLTQSAETQKTNVFWTLIYIRKGIGMYILESDLRPINEGEIIISYDPAAGGSREMMKVILKGLGVPPSQASVTVRLKR